LTLNAAETSGVANDNEICSGDTITFTAAGNQAGDTIQWLVDGIAPAGALTDPRECNYLSRDCSSIRSAS